MRYFSKLLLIIAMFAYAINLSHGADQQKNDPPVVVKTGSEFFDPNNPEAPYTRQLIDFMRNNPSIEVQQWGGIAIPGGGKASLMMAIAGKTAPDFGQSWFHLIRNEIKQQFLYPLNEWIGDDTNGNGIIDDSEAKWAGWKNIPPLWRKVATIKGKVYGIPLPTKSTVAILYRTDMIKSAGLDPNKPPRTWDEFYYWCQRLSDPKKKIPGAIIQNGQRGISLPTNGYLFLPWIQSAGGQPIVQIRKSPKTGKSYEFPVDAVKFVTPDGEDLSQQPSDWRANFASKEGQQAISLLYKLRWGKWISDPESGEPIALSEKDLQNNYVTFNNKKIKITPEIINTGVARGYSSQPGTSPMELLGRGEVAMVITHVEDLKTIGTNANIDASSLSWFPFPAMSEFKGNQVVQIQNHYGIMYTGVGERTKKDRDAIWKALTSACDKKVIDNQVTSNVLVRAEVEKCRMRKELF